MWEYNYDYLEHHGIHGQKWGVRRFQNKDGSLTAAGKKRYGAASVDEISSKEGISKRLNDLDEARVRNLESLGEYNMARGIYAERSNKAREAGNMERAKSNFYKSQDAYKKVKDFEQYYFKGEEETDRLLSKIEKEGWDWNAIAVPRYPRTVFGPSRLGFRYTVKDKNNVEK